MKKLMTIFGAIMIGSLLLTSCVSTNKGFQSSPVNSRNVETDPIMADIQIDEKNKLKGKSTSSYLFFIFRVGGDNTFADGIDYRTDASVNKFNLLKQRKNDRLNEVRGAAAFKALSKGDYDVLVNPSYTTTVKNYHLFKQYVVTVEGYGGKYTNFRTEKQKAVTLESGKKIIIIDE